MNEGIKKMIDLSIIVPCYNEQGNLHELVDRIKKTLAVLSINYEIILVDDFSEDQTLNEIMDLYKTYTNIVWGKHDKNYGMAVAWQTGIDLSHGEHIVFIDADLQYQPEDIIRLFREIIRSKTDIVQGYRSTIGRLKDSRLLLSKGLHYTLNLLFGMRLKDNKSGFIIAKRDVIKDIFISRFKYYYFQSFLLVAANSKGYSIKEIEVLFTDRLIGKSFIGNFPLKMIFKILLDIIKALYEFRISNKKTTLLSWYVEKYGISEKGAPKRSIFKKMLNELYFYTMPFHAWMISKNVRTYYYELSKSQWFTRDQIESLQLEKLKKLLSHVYDHVEYYRIQFDSLSIKPSDIRTLEDLIKLPFLTKVDINENLHFGILSDNHNKKEMLKIVTSGSSGIPFTCYADKYQLEMRWAATLRSMEWTGYVFGDKCARLWHQTIGMNLTQIIKEKIDATLSRRYFIPAYSLKNNKIEKYLEKLSKINPVLIDGYAESFNFLAQYIQSGKKLKLSPKAIISSAQILPTQSRNLIENEFNTKVYDKYGSREFSGIAYESGTADEHLVVAENYIVEIISNNKKAAPGEIGEIVITDLNNYSLPFIRYKIGDLAVAVDPKKISDCGRGLPLIGKIEGRIQSIIIGTNGNYLPGTFFAHFFKENPHIIQQYQVIQYELGALQLKIIKGQRFNQIDFDKILDALKSHVGNEMNFEILFVDEIQMVRTGKQQGVISKLKIDFQQIR